MSQENHLESSPNYFFKTNYAVGNTVYMWNGCIFAHYRQNNEQLRTKMHIHGRKNYQRHYSAEPDQKGTKIQTWQIDQWGLMDTTPLKKQYNVASSHPSKLHHRTNNAVQQLLRSQVWRNRLPKSAERSLHILNEELDFFHFQGLF